MNRAVHLRVLLATQRSAFRELSRALTARLRRGE